MQALRSAYRARSALSLPAATRAFSSSPAHNVAKLILTGRLAAEPELTTTSSGQEVVRYSVGTSHGPRENRQTSWFRVTSFTPEGPQRDYLLSLPKGTLVYVEADASIRAYEDAEGRRQHSLGVIQRSLEVLKRPYVPDGQHEQGPDAA
ncbi:hypothetical protein VTN31DRAFT_4743 [Thermomyces dupontii]|uniref:uncharacterized protein n=1 Tax=Talaromyces thermophilus TaxID=28565 RepID=UPI0037440B98